MYMMCRTQKYQNLNVKRGITISLKFWLGFWKRGRKVKLNSDVPRSHVMALFIGLKDLARSHE